MLVIQKVLREKMLGENAASKKLLREKKVGAVVSLTSRFRVAIVAAAVFLGSLTSAAGSPVCLQDSVDAAPQLSVEIKKQGDHCADVFAGADTFVTLDAEKYGKPILWPLMGPGQVRMTRQWPMETVPGEAHDHPHHKGIWWAHGIVNGADFWVEKDNIKNSKLTVESNTIRLENHWQHDDQVILTEETQLLFNATPSARWIDFDIQLIATHGAVTLGDTKEGFWAIRTHPDLRLSAAPKEGVAEVFGQAVNSEGVKGKAIWGRAAAWVAYFGPIDGQQMYLLMIDHPENLRHPTTWHARDYGLVAANPFGLHEFLGQPPGAGKVELAPEQRLRLRYRLVVGSGEWNSELAKEFSKAW